MPAIVDVKLERKVNLKFSRPKVFNFISNTENIKTLFQNLDDVSEEDDSSWRIKFKPVVVSGVNHAIEFVVKITDDKNTLVKWDPLEVTGTNSKVLINWNINENGISDSVVEIELRGRYEVGVPRLMQRLAETVIKEEVTKQLDAAVNVLKEKQYT